MFLLVSRRGKKEGQADWQRGRKEREEKKVLLEQKYVETLIGRRGRTGPQKDKGGTGNYFPVKRYGEKKKAGKTGKRRYH